MSIAAQTQAAMWRMRRNTRSRFFVGNLTPWSSALTVAVGDYVQSFGLAWQAQNAGTTGATAPNNSESALVTDGVVDWLQIPLLLVQPPTI